MENETSNFETSDNLEETQLEPVEADNSEIEEESKPEIEEDEEEEEKEELILGKFKTQDDLIKAYNDLQSVQGKKSQELATLKEKAEKVDSLIKEQQEIAEFYGFKNVEEMRTAQAQKTIDKELANFVANEYEKHLDSCEYPDEMKTLLDEYRKNPDKELLATIKNEFPLDIIEDVAVNINSHKGQLDNIRHQALEKEEMARASEYLKENIAKYDDDRYFKNNEFQNIYTELFKAFGTDLNTDYTIDIIEKYVQSRIKAHERNKSKKYENDSLTDSFGSINQNDNIGSTKGVLDMSPDELKHALRTTYKDL